MAREFSAADDRVSVRSDRADKPLGEVQERSTRDPGTLTRRTDWAPPDSRTVRDAWSTSSEGRAGIARLRRAARHRDRAVVGPRSVRRRELRKRWRAKSSQLSPAGQF